MIESRLKGGRARACGRYFDVSRASKQGEHRVFAKVGAQRS